MLDGGGYGYWRNLYLDSDPSLLIATGRLHQTHPDKGWLREVDVGLRCAAGLFTALGDVTYAAECRQAANRIRAAYAAVFLNPKTGWVAGWRSRDGQLHDYAFLWVNGPAIAYGLLDWEASRQALLRLEAVRAEAGAGEGYFGLPANLHPTAADDHMMPLIWDTAEPTFEKYTDGAYNGFVLYYLRALSIYGLAEQSDKLARELAYGLAAGYFNGGIGTGTEFHTWAGLRTGYEGTLISNTSAVYALAILYGYLRPSEPEWWPVGGE